MSHLKSRLIGATLGAIVAMSIGGATYAFAQTATDDGTTTTTGAPAATEAPAATAPATPDDCPDHAGSGGGGPSDNSDPSTTDSTAGAGEV